MNKIAELEVNKSLHRPFVGHYASLVPWAVGMWPPGHKEAASRGLPTWRGLRLRFLLAGAAHVVTRYCAPPRVAYSPLRLSAEKSVPSRSMNDSLFAASPPLEPLDSDFELPLEASPFSPVDFASFTPSTT